MTHATPVLARAVPSPSPLSFWAKTGREKDEIYQVLRADHPVSWQPPAEGSMMPQQGDDAGYWAVVRHADVITVSRDPETFSSARGIQMEDVPDDISEAASSFLATDAPRHTHLRRLVSSAFTPRRLRTLEGQLKVEAKTIVDQLIERGDGGDFVRDLSARLPMWTVFTLMGVPESQRLRVAETAAEMVAWADEDVQAGREPAEVLHEALLSLISTGLNLAEERRRNPQDDLLTNLVQAEIDGQRLTDEEISAFFVLLSVGGNDTTRQTTSHAALALTEHRRQREWLMADFDGRIGHAVEEMVRWATPVMTFRRTALRDTVLNGQEISEGDWVVMFYQSANRDETVFDRPWDFDLSRDPNPHVGFGGGGPHFCLGYQLAKTQLRIIFDELLHRVPDFEVADPVRLRSNFIDGITSMPYRLNLR
ncbi:MAG TPA: cytochrome P450 [Sporichthya sp.]|nr:cytochrome P450 [Sporichthya sp.]